MSDIVERLRLKMTHASVIDRRYAKPMSWNEAELLISEIDRLNAEIARLREALTKFAEHFGPLEDNELLHPMARECFALARAALAEQEPK